MTHGREAGPPTTDPDPVAIVVIIGAALGMLSNGAALLSRFAGTRPADHYQKAAPLFGTSLIACDNSKSIPRHLSTYSRKRTSAKAIPLSLGDQSSCHKRTFVFISM